MGASDNCVRAFLAVELDSGSRAAIASLIERLRPQLPGISWARAETAHVTLRFLGNVSQNLLERYVAVLHDTASPAHPVPARVVGVGAFPSLRRASVLWAGVEFGSPEIARIQREAERAARASGLEPDTRAFTPHVTLGRAKRGVRGPALAAALEQERDFSAHEFTVDSVSLFSSALTSNGAIHTRLYRFSNDGIRGQSGF